MGIFNFIMKDPKEEPTLFLKIMTVFAGLFLLAALLFGPLLLIFGNKAVGTVDRFGFKTAFIKYTYKNTECECKLGNMSVDSVGQKVPIRFFPFATNRCSKEFGGIKPIDKIGVRKN